MRAARGVGEQCIVPAGSPSFSGHPGCTYSCGAPFWLPTARGTSGGRQTQAARSPQGQARAATRASKGGGRQTAPYSYKGQRRRATGAAAGRVRRGRPGSRPCRGSRHGWRPLPPAGGDDPTAHLRPSSARPARGLPPPPHPHRRARAGVVAPRRAAPPAPRQRKLALMPDGRGWSPNALGFSYRESEMERRAASRCEMSDRLRGAAWGRRGGGVKQSAKRHCRTGACRRRRDAP